MSVSLELRLNEYVDVVGQRLAAWGGDNVLARIWEKDHTVWCHEEVPELSDRLGWIDLPDRLASIIPSLESFRDDLIAEGIKDVVVLGMGGSSLAPEVFATVFGSTASAPELRVLDSTHPAAVESTAAAIDIERAVFIVASKSGTTIEPLSFMEYFWERASAATATPGRHFVATTDPGSNLEALAIDRGFRSIFLAPPDVGGRYSALTEFGMVPAAAIGVDLKAIAAAAYEAQADHSATSMVASAAGCRLGAALGELALAGRDKVTFLTSPSLAAFPAWIEQLIAESTGKDDTGIVPIAGEASGARSAYAADRFFITLSTAQEGPIDVSTVDQHPRADIMFDSTTDIGAAMYLFEMATALAGKVLGIQPFNQPDVQHAKELAREAMDGSLDATGVVEIDAMAEDLADHMHKWLGSASRGDYVGVHAFLEPTAETKRILNEARLAIRDHLVVATTVDFGPRFLHSTGQLHKGGPNTGLFLEIIDHPGPEVPVPNTAYDFSKLITAQSIGDHMALRGRDRRVLLVCLGDDGTTALQRVADTVASLAQ